MNIQNNFVSNGYKQYIEREKQQQKQMEATAKTATNPEIRKYLEASNKVMSQLNSLDEFVLTSAMPKEKPKGIFAKIKSVFKKIF